MLDSPRKPSACWRAVAKASCTASAARSAVPGDAQGEGVEPVAVVDQGLGQRLPVAPGAAAIRPSAKAALALAPPAIVHLRVGRRGLHRTSTKRRRSSCGQRAQPLAPPPVPSRNRRGWGWTGSRSAGPPSGWSSTSSLATGARPPSPAARASTTGASFRQGGHQVAQKSTSTSPWRLEPPRPSLGGEGADHTRSIQPPRDQAPG